MPLCRSEFSIDELANRRLCLPPMYRARLRNEHHDDLALKDEWQKEVYEYASRVAVLTGLKNILDVGCGSAFKLQTQFPFEKDRGSLYGVDVEQTVAALREQHPQGKWDTRINAWPHVDMDLVICSDMIEHVLEPEDIFRQIRALGPRRVVISTPNRDLLESGNLGPPNNPAHVREWGFDEFRSFVSRHFHVLGHFISNAEQATQVIDCEMKER